MNYEMYRAKVIFKMLLRCIFMCWKLIKMGKRITNILFVLTIVCYVNARMGQ